MQHRVFVVAALCSAFAVHASSAQVGWRIRSRAPVEAGPRAAFDHVHGMVLSIGAGPSAGGASGTSLWRASTWNRVPTPVAPPGLFGHAVASDSNRRRVVLFGGTSGFVPQRYHDETWEWDGRSWRKLGPRTVPPGRLGHAMAYDPARGVVVMFGGFDGSRELDDTWEWNGTDWRSRTPAVRPSPRSRHAMAFHAASGGVVLLGGHDNESWLWTGGNGASWVRLRSAIEPPARGGHGMAYDPVRQRLVVHGGFSGPAPNLTVLDDTWEWDGRSWALRAVGGPPPTGVPGMQLHGHGMAFDLTRGVTVLHGGVDASGTSHSETYEWDGTQWFDRRTGGPGHRIQAAMTFDSDRRTALLFGGARRGLEDDTWSWDGNEWTELHPVHAPAPRRGSYLTYVTSRKRAVLVGGEGLSGDLWDTWEFDGADWAEQRPRTSPPARIYHALAADDDRGRVVLFGGDRRNGWFLGDTWEWDGNDWSLRSSTGPPARIWSAMAFDRRRGVTVLFGGYLQNATHADDTWTWDGATWTRLTPATRPPARREHAMVYDSHRQRVVLLGGQDQRGVFLDTWEWDGTDWRQRSPAPGLAAQYGAAFAYDEERREILAHGGVALGAFPSAPRQFQTWAYGPTDPARVSEFGTGCAGGAARAPRLTTDPYSLPWTGDTFTQRVLYAPVNARIAVILGVSDRTWNGAPLPLDLGPLGMRGCSLYTSYDAVLGVPNRGGAARLDLAIPGNPALVGATLFGQATVTAPGANPLGVLSSNGIRMTIGQR